MVEQCNRCHSTFNIKLMLLFESKSTDVEVIHRQIAFEAFKINRSRWKRKMSIYPKSQRKSMKITSYCDHIWISSAFRGQFTLNGKKQKIRRKKSVEIVWPALGWFCTIHTINVSIHKSFVWFISVLFGACISFVLIVVTWNQVSVVRFYNRFRCVNDSKW